MIRRFQNFRPALVYGFALLWTFHFSFGMLQHYHPEYTHGHDGALVAHHHGGHFHSLELDRLAHFFDHGLSPHSHGETHHHSEGMPGSDPESAQYDLNPSSLPESKVAMASPLDFAPVIFTREPPASALNLFVSSDTRRTLLWSPAHSERSPPLQN